MAFGCFRLHKRKDNGRYLKDVSCKPLLEIIFQSYQLRVQIRTAIKIARDINNR